MEIMDNDNVIKEISKLSLEKGDIFVVKLPNIKLTSDLYIKTKEIIRNNIPPHIKVLILTDNVNVGVIKDKTGEYWDLFSIN